MILTFLEFCCSCMAFDKGNPISTTMVEVRRQKVETNERFPQKIFFILPTKISSLTKQTFCCRCSCHCFLLLNSEMYFCSCYHQQMCFLDSIIVTSWYISIMFIFCFMKDTILVFSVFMELIFLSFE